MSSHIVYNHKNENIKMNLGISNEMTSIYINDQLIKAILNVFQEVLIELSNINNKEYIEKYGVPPKSVIVKYHDYFSIRSEKVGNIISSWRVTATEIECINELEYEATTSPISGMYYNEGSCLFSINPRLKTCILEGQIGPRYGRGYIYDILGDGEYRLQKKDILWTI